MKYLYLGAVMFLLFVMAPETTVAASYLEGNIDIVKDEGVVYGWAYDNGKDVKVEVTIQDVYDNSKIYTAVISSINFGEARGDVTEYLKRKTGNSYVSATGFSIDFKNHALPGQYKIVKATFNKKKFKISKAAKTQFYIQEGTDRFNFSPTPSPTPTPQASTATKMGYLDSINNYFAQGWAYDNSNPITLRFTFENIASPGIKIFVEVSADKITPYPRMDVLEKLGLYRVTGFYQNISSFFKDKPGQYRLVEAKYNTNTFPLTSANTSMFTVY